jgi:hypothetical protein
MMNVTRVNLGIARAMLRDLERLAAQEGFDRTNAIRYCIRYTCDAKLKGQPDTTKEPRK